MWSFLANLAANFLGWYAGSPYAQKMVKQVVTDLKTEGAKMLPVVIDSIKEVATDDSLSTKGKFDYVANKVVASGIDAGASMANSIIDLTYRTLKNDPTVPEVQ